MTPFKYANIVEGNYFYDRKEELNKELSKKLIRNLFLPIRCIACL